MNETGSDVKFTIDKRVFRKKIVIETIEMLRDFASFELSEVENRYEIKASEIVEDLADNFEDEFCNYLIYLNKGLRIRKEV